MAVLESWVMATKDLAAPSSATAPDGPADDLDPPEEGETWLIGPRKIWRFLLLSVRKAQQDNLTQQSAALAFTTIVSLVPLLAAFSFLGARWFSRQNERTLQLLAELLPYSADNLTTQLEVFVGQAATVRGVGFAVFVITSLMVFTLIESIINHIWNVPHSRPFRSRLLSFTLLLFWGPMVIGATYSLLFYLRQQSAFQAFNESIPAELLPLLVTTLGLTMLYWQVPYVAVRFRSALTGGLVAAFLLEALRQGFGLYVQQARSISLIYGSFGFAFFFMISVQLTWWIVLLGTEVSYCVQNYAFMSRSRRPAAPAEGSWIALAVLAILTLRFRQGQPLTPHEMLAERLQIKADDLRQVVTPLLEQGILQEAGGDAEGYLLSRDPYELEAREIFEIYEERHWQFLEAMNPTLVHHLQDLRQRLTQHRGRALGKLTLAKLAEPVPKPTPVGDTHPEPEGQAVVV